MNISFSGQTLPKTGSLVLTVAAQGLGARGARLGRGLKSGLERAMRTQSFTGRSKQVLRLVAPANSRLDNIILIGLGDVAELTQNDYEQIGGEIAGHCAGLNGAVTVLADFTTPAGIDQAEASAYMALGACLRGYAFSKYKKLDKDKAVPRKLLFAVSDAAKARRHFAPLKKLAGGVSLARDLVNEPANVLTPPEFASRCRALSKLGLKVEVLSEAKMERLGMNALLAVGQGSVQPSQLVVMHWQGADKNEKPLAFIGKGVCFDTGGISIKPAGGMEDMRGDMGGAAAVTGLMHVLAARKARVNAVGIIGLVENMPSGTAQRPGDIVTSMSGQTIEVLNTDAEGRLVLADALWYAQKHFKPQLMIDVATLTGAILVALGKNYAGLFSNDDELSAQLLASGICENEKLWRMPLDDDFDKMINTPQADMKNIGGRFAGSSTAAQFLQRFTNKTAWAHIDIAGTAMASPKSSINHSWGSGFGVKLLNRLVRDYYEHH